VINTLNNFKNLLLYL